MRNLALGTLKKGVHEYHMHQKVKKPIIPPDPKNQLH